MKLTVSVERIHACKRLLAPFTGVRSDIKVKLFMSLAIVLPRESFATSRPLALIWSFFRMGPQMAYTK